MTEQLSILAVISLGLATAVAPCPLATNIAALSYIARKLTDRRWVLVTGGLYTLGRSLAYTGLAAILVAGLTNLPGLSTSLQYYGDLLLGPILVLVGMILLQLITIPLPSASGQAGQQLADRWGLFGAFLLGVLFAMAFCPTSAAYFGTVVAVLVGKSAASVYLAALYGIATGLPVAVFAVLIALGVSWIGKAFQVLSIVDRAVRLATGVIFIVIGVYFILRYNLGLPLDIVPFLS